MKRIYHPYWLWEDYKAGLYDLTKEYSELELEAETKSVKNFLTNSKLFYEIGLKIIKEWKNAAEVNLSNSSRNKQAWIGQSAVCYYLGLPEHITKMGWGLLSPKEQKEANRIADLIIKKWENRKDGKKVFKQKRLASI